VLLTVDRRAGRVVASSAEIRRTRHAGVVPEPRVAGQPAGFAALVELRDHAGRQAMLQVEAAYPAEVELEQLVRQALTQAGRRAGWQLQRWRPVTDASFPPANGTQVGGWGQ